MIFSEPLSQYEEILKDAIRTSMKESGAKLAKTFQTLLIEILTLYMILPRKINFTQMARYGKHGEQTYRQNFNRKKKDCIDWLLLNLSLARRVLEMDGLLAIAIAPCYISKAGKKTPHIGRFWSGCAGAVKHGLEIMGIGLLDVANNKCMMLRAHQTIGNSALKMRNKTLAENGGYPPTQNGDIRSLIQLFRRKELQNGFFSRIPNRYHSIYRILQAIPRRSTLYMPHKRIEQTTW